MKAVDGDALRRLTETPAAEVQSAWSPDGREIAFVRAGQGVFIVSALGGQERRISGSGSVVGWTPDSTSLLVRDRTDEGYQGIFRIELATGTRHQVTRPPRGVGDWVFAVSPDGSTLAFVRYGMPGISDVYVAPIAGGEPRRRTNWNASISGVSWASDGREILYRLPKLPGLITECSESPPMAIGSSGVRGCSTPVWPACRCLVPDGSARPNPVHQETHRCRSSPRRSRGSTGWRRLSKHQPLFRLHARGRSGPVLAGRETGRLPVR